MLHKLKMPLYRSQLNTILDFQYQLLAFACTAPSLPLNSDMFAVAFGQQRGEWLSKRCWRGKQNTKLYKELEELITYSRRHPLEGPQITAAFKNDRDFYNHIDDPDFEFLYPLLPQTAKDVIAPLMVSFYKDLLEMGFPGCVHLYNTETFTRKILLRDFYAANANLKVCPGCDGPAPRLSNETRNRKSDEENTNRDYAQVDHFFPKALYPFFSVHFMNLVPLCPVCNISAKQLKDPLNKCVGKGALCHTFVPFIKPATPHIEVTLSKKANNRPGVKIKDTQVVSSQRVKNLDLTFELSANWDHHLEGWVESMQFRFRGARSRKRNRQTIERAIKETLTPLAKAQEEDIGQIPYLLVERGYANYILKDRQELDVLIDLAMDDNAPRGRHPYSR